MNYHFDELRQNILRVRRRRAFRLTLREVCQQSGLDPDKAVGILKQQGITAEPDMTMRQIADQHGVHPSQLREMLDTP